MTTEYSNARVYYDCDTDPSNPGWVCMYDQGNEEDGFQNSLTECLDAEDEAAAIKEAAKLLSLPTSDITVE